MNANELADELQELDSKLHLIDLFKAATMLRQQQARIQELEQALVALSLKLGSQNTGGGTGYAAMIKVEHTCCCNQRPMGGYGGGQARNGGGCGSTSGGGGSGTGGTIEREIGK